MSESLVTASVSASTARFGEQVGLPPSVEQEDPALFLPELEGVTRVQVDAEGTAVELRSPDLHELDQLGVEARVRRRLLNFRVHGEQSFVRVFDAWGELNSRGHALHAIPNWPTSMVQSYDRIVVQF